MSKREWIQYLDADDELLPYVICYMIGADKEMNADVIYGNRQ